MYVKTNKDGSLTVGDPSYLVGQEVSLAVNVTDKELAGYGIYPLVTSLPYERQTQKLVTIDPALIDGAYYGVQIAELSLEETMIGRVIQLAKNYDAKIAAGMPYQGSTYDIDETAENRMNSVQTKFLKGGTNWHGGHWTTMDNKNVPMTDADVQAFFDAAYVWKLTLIQSAQGKRADIVALKDVTSVLSYDVTL